MVYDTPLAVLKRHNMPTPVMTTLSILKENHYQAWVVGGCVRDILFGREPKDFDIATDAQPRQICQIFKKSRIVGKRFPVVHVREQNELMEVTTLRQKSENDNDIATKTKNTSWDKLLINDAKRRDYTVNSMYYDPLDPCLYDCLNAYQDLTAGRLRCIGTADRRFSEDPVRMLRGLYFQARLGLQPDDHLINAIKDNASQITYASAARLSGESEKIFNCGHVQTLWPLLQEYGFIKYLFPTVYALPQDIKHNQSYHLIRALTKLCDERYQQQQRNHLPLYMATILWHPLEHSSRTKPLKKSQRQQHMMKLLSKQSRSVAIRIRQQEAIMAIWSLQHRLIDAIQHNQQHHIQNLLSHPEFYSALALLELRGHDNADIAQYHQQWQHRYDHYYRKPRRHYNKSSRDNRIKRRY